MNFPTEFVKGQKGENKGLDFGPGLENITMALNGIQKKRYFTLASAAKTGKSTLINYAFVYAPYLQSLKEGLNIKWLYYSLEMGKIDLEFDAACFFMNNDFNIEVVFLPDGVKKDGKNFIPLSPSYLRGRELDDNKNIIQVSGDIEDKVKVIYKTRLVPLFGEYNVKGEKIKNGCCFIVEKNNNPTGIYRDALSFAEQYGTINYDIVKDSNGYIVSKRPVSFTPSDPEFRMFLILDHIRRLHLESGKNEKQNIEKMSSYFIELRNVLECTIGNIVHLNRSLNDLDRFKQFGKYLYPDSDMIKSSAGMAEDSDYILTMFNPNDERYNLKEHFDLTIRDTGNNPLYPNLRTIHLVESRHCAYPQHFRTIMEGNLKKFKQFKK